MAGHSGAGPANQGPNTAHYASVTPMQITFGGGVNPAVPAHLLKDDEVQTATNIDFSLMPGALVPRRGCYLSTNLGTSSITRIFRNYNDNATYVQGFLYAVNGNGVVYRGTGPFGTGMTAIATLGSAGAAGAPAFAAYKQFTVFTNGTAHFKDDGTNCTEWIKQVPPAPTVTVSTLTPVSLTGTFSSVVGAITSSNTASCTFTSDANGNAAVQLVFGTSLNLSVNGTNTIGQYGAFINSVAFADPTIVQSISLDFALDTAFANFWHYELDPSQGGVVVGGDNADVLAGLQLAGTDTNNGLDSEERQAIISQLAQFNFNPLSLVSAVSNSLCPWAVTVPQFSFVGTAGTGSNLWSAIVAMRVNVQSVLSSTVLQTCTVVNPALYGAQNYPLTDVHAGYYYWQTFATLDANGNKIDESASSPPAGPYPMQNAQTKVANTGTATGSQHGVNAIITYRAGGYMTDAYAIYTYTGTGTTSSVIAISTITDTLSDITALSNNFVMQRNLMPPSYFPGDVTAIAVMSDRIWINDANILYWSSPGMIGSFPKDSFQEVGRIGDAVASLQPWNPGMVITNRSSVYELTGTDFEAGQFVLTRTGARRGSLAPDTAIQTPYGIPLLNTDGLSLYVPGYDRDQPIAWFNEKYSDMFKGSDSTGPAVYKGNRIPALNLGSIQFSCAGFRGHQLYLGLPIGPQAANQKPNLLLVVDFELKQAWWYTYPFSFTSIYVDDRQSTIYLGSTDGSLMVIETSVGDQTTAGVVVPMVWSARTKQWSAKSDSVLENLSIDNEGDHITVSAYYDNYYTPIVGTLSNQVRQYTTPPLNGTFVTSVAFDFVGVYTPVSTASSTLNAIYSMAFDILREPTKVQYWRTEYDEHGYTADKLWDVIYCDIDIPGTCTVSAVTFVDNTAVMTNTITGTGGGRSVYEFAFPPEIYGRVAYTTYTL